MKVWNYVFISVGLLTLLEIAGIRTAANWLFSIIGLVFNSFNQFESVGISAASFFNELFGVVGDNVTGILLTLAATVGGIIASLVARARFENIILLPLITSTLVLFIATFSSIINYAIGTSTPWVAAIIALILIPFTVGFILALAEFFRGTD